MREHIISLVKEHDVLPKNLVTHTNLLKQLLRVPVTQLINECANGYTKAALKNAYLSECSKNMLFDEQDLQELQ